jgi:hypothetical protein
MASRIFLSTLYGCGLLMGVPQSIALQLSDLKITFDSGGVGNVGFTNGIAFTGSNAEQDLYYDFGSNIRNITIEGLLPNTTYALRFWSINNFSPTGSITYTNVTGGGSSVIGSIVNGNATSVSSFNDFSLSADLTSDGNGTIKVNRAGTVPNLPLNGLHISGGGETYTFDVGWGAYKPGGIANYIRPRSGVPSFTFQNAKRVYFVGNSGTGDVDWVGLPNLIQNEGSAINFGRQIMPGGVLRGNFLNTNVAFLEWAQPYGTATAAFSANTWDAVTLQPAYRPMGNVTDPATTDADVPQAKNFIDTLLLNPKNAVSDVYLFSRWAFRVTDGAGGWLPFDYQSKWDGPATDSNQLTRAYMETMADKLNAHFSSSSLNKPIRIIPCGEVFYELAIRMRNGEIPGFSQVGDFYVDHGHLKDVGQYVVALTTYATIYGRKPASSVVGGEYGTIAPDVAATFRDVVWDVVSTYAYSKPLTGYAAWRGGIFWNGGNSTHTGNPDGDDLTNFEEYALGGDPLSALSAPRPQAETTTDNLTLTYLRARAEVSYTVEVSPTLANGSWSANGVVQDVTTPIGGLASASVPFNLASSQKVFLRLRVSEP